MAGSVLCRGGSHVHLSTVYHKIDVAREGVEYIFITTCKEHCLTEEIFWALCWEQANSKLITVGFTCDP